MKHLATLALLLVCSGALAGEAVLTWTAPTHNTDGSELTDLAGYRVYHGTEPGTLTVAHETPARAHTVKDLAPGTHYFAVTAFNAGGTESALSGIGSKSIEAVPAVLRVADVRAYRMRQAVNGFELVQLGTVPVGTECQPDLQVNGYHAIAREAVTLTNRFDTLPLVVFAQCSAD